jgi:DNA-binding CsgD family transcriptional regulator
MTTAILDGAVRHRSEAKTTAAVDWERSWIDRLNGPLTRSSLARAMRDLCAAVNAEQFCLADLSRSHAEEPPQVLSSNWSLDAIEIIGTSSIELLSQSPFAVSVCETPRPFETARIERRPRVVDETVALRLLEYGHVEVFLLRLRAGLRRGVCVFSASVPGRIDRSQLRHVHLAANYLVSRYRDVIVGAASDPLTDRERECLFWVSEGKTTEDIAMILGVSAHTVNKFIVSSIQKLSADNRTMAVAVAIRNGVI